MKKLFTFLLALMLNAAAFAQGYYTTVCVNLSGPPLTGPTSAILTYTVNGYTDTSIVNISNVTLPYNFCFPAFLAIPDTGNSVLVTGTVSFTNCGPMFAYNFTNVIWGTATINVNAQNCGSAGACGVTLSQTPGTVILQATATGTAPFTYSWDGGLTYTGNSSYTMNTYGTYCVTVMDATGCTSTDCFTLQNNCSASITSSGSGPWTLLASSTGNPPFTYYWDNGQSTPAISVNAPGYYCVTVLDANNCADSVCYFVQGPNNCGANIVFGNAPANGDYLMAMADSGSAFGATYLWNTGETTQTIFPTASGQYCVVISYANGCTATSCYNYTGGNNGNVCSVLATAIPDSSNAGYVFFSCYPTGTAPFSYNWVFSNGTVSTQANPYVNMNNNTGINWGFVTVTDASGCVSYYSVSVVLPNNNLNCNAYFTMAANYNTGNAGEIFFQDQSFATGGVVSYAWDFGDNNISSSQNPNHTYASAGYYNVCLTISNASGCSATWCTNIYVDPAWWTSSPFQGNCTAGFLVLGGPNNSAGMASIINISQGNNLYYTWNVSNGTTFNTPNPFFTFSSSGAYSICLTILDTVSSCTDTYCDTIMVDSLGNISRSPLSGNVGVAVYSTAQPNNLLSVVDEAAVSSTLVPVPNPSNGLVSFTTNNTEAGISVVEIFDISGKLTAQYNLKSVKGLYNHVLDLNHLNNGVYLMKVTAAGEVNSARLMIQK